MPATGNRADLNLKLPWIRIEDQTLDPSVMGGEMPERSSANGKPGQAGWQIFLLLNRLLS